MEIKENGKMTEELGNIFQTLAQPNMEKNTTKDRPLRCRDPWYDIARDNGSPQYTMNPETKKWSQYYGKRSVNNNEDTTSTSPRKDSYSTKKTASRGRPASKSCNIM
jgi:hypothetical protein